MDLKAAIMSLQLKETKDISRTDFGKFRLGRFRSLLAISKSTDLDQGRLSGFVESKDLFLISLAVTRFSGFY